MNKKRSLSDLIRLFESINNVKIPANSVIKEEIVNNQLLNESRQTEEIALKILKAKNVENPQDAISNYKKEDTSKNQILIPVMAYFHGEQFGKVFENLTKLIEKNHVKPPTIGKEGIIVDGNKFKSDEFLKFQEYIDGVFGKKVGMETKFTKGEVGMTTDKPIFDANGITIYDANNRDKCIIYSQGGVTGKKYSFCIGEWVVSQNMWQSYRDLQSSTYYFVVDKNRDFESDPLHIVVVDATENGLELTDATNYTGNIAEYGKDPEKYLEYLKSKGVNTDKIFVNKEKTPQEKEEERILKPKNSSLEWFKNLSYDYKSKYIGRGHSLTNDQFELLWLDRNSKGFEQLILQYLNTGIPLNDYQFNKIAQEDN